MKMKPFFEDKKVIFATLKCAMAKATFMQTVAKGVVVGNLPWSC